MDLLHLVKGSSWGGSTDRVLFRRSKKFPSTLLPSFDRKGVGFEVRPTPGSRNLFA